MTAQPPSHPNTHTPAVVLLDYSGTLTDPTGPIDPELSMRPVSTPARKAIVALCQMKVTLALLSNTHHGQDRRRALRAAGVHDAFGDRVFLSHESGRRKPDRRAFQAVLDALGVTAEDTLMCGNSWLKDVAPALNLGMRAVLIGAPPQLPDPLPPAVACIGDIAHLPPLLLTGQPS
ncbi:HAD family hydrolase [Actinomadura roseirufa]|uniref:HAD family hydrolase n=1 Tax=Actinomadura roseirufa TaxID=2094049 RepID=UPI001041B4C9|nr:HAD family hydrolase [Actinomadura roseirufa]